MSWMCPSPFVTAYLGREGEPSPFLFVSPTSRMQHHKTYVNLLRHYATSGKVAGSIPDEVTGFFN
jgi:hypothetical protein